MEKGKKMVQLLLGFIQIASGSLQQTAEEYLIQGIFQLAVGSSIDGVTDMTEKRTKQKFQMILEFSLSKRIQKKSRNKQQENNRITLKNFKQY